MSETQLQKQYKTFSAAPKYSLDSEELFCVCRKPDTGKLMVACDGCDEWFHFKCMGLDPKYKDLVSNYYCKFCDDLFHKGKTLWKRKCKLSHCFTPINASVEAQSQFCSKEHGLLYWKEIMEKFNGSFTLNHDSTETIRKDEVANVFQTISSRSELESLGTELPVYDKTPIVMNDKKRDEIKQNEVFLSNCTAQIELYKSRRVHLTALKELIVQINEHLTNSLDSANDDNNGASKDQNEEGSTPTEDKKKKVKGKRNQKSRKSKVDICGYDARLELGDKEWSEFIQLPEFSSSIHLSQQDFQNISAAYHTIKSNDDDKMEVDPPTSMLDKICSSDKRKCTLHGGWFNVFKGRYELKINELTLEQEVKAKANEDLLRAIQIKNWKIYCGEV